MNRKLLLALVIVLAVAATATAALLLSSRQPQAGPGSVPIRSTSSTASPPAPVTKTLDEAEVKAALPAGLLAEKGSRLLLSQQTTYPQSGEVKVQTTATTARTLTEVFAAFQKYLKDNQWSVFDRLDQATLKELAASKGRGRLDIAISYDGGSSSNVVAITYSRLPLR